MGSPRRAPLSQSSLYSNWSVNSSWSQSSRLEPREEFWVSLNRGGETPKRPETTAGRRPGRPPPPPGPRPSSAGSGKPPKLPKVVVRSRSLSRDSVHEPAENSAAAPRGSTARRPTSQRRSQRAQEESKEWTTPPLGELVPREVRSKVLGLAGKGAALIVEMLWSSSCYLPAHNGGQKYKEFASSLRELMEGRISRGFPLPVLTFDTPVSLKRKSPGIYDRYSEWERSFGLVASNSSYSYAPPSRMGAFEVHLVQGSWDPELCARGPLEKDTHRGPPVSGSLGILCSSCALRLTHGAAAAEQPMSPEQKKNYEKQMQQQHSLLHSKLWTRRWPGLRHLVGRVGAILIRPVPAVARPVPLRRVEFRKPLRHQLERFNFTFERKAVFLPPDPVQSIRQELSALDCPAAKGWFITVDEGDETLCRCGGGSHRLGLQEVQDILQSLGFDASAFQSFCWKQKKNWKGQGVNEFIAQFLKLEMQHILDEKQEEHRREVSRRAQEELAYQQLSQHDHYQEQDEICKEYAKAFEDSHPEAEKIYVSLCLFLVRKIPSHGLDLRRLERGEVTVEEAERVVAEALKLNDERREKWSGWYEEVESWKRDDSDEELAIWDAILTQRPDVADMVSYKENEPFTAERLEEDIQSFEAKMKQAYPSPEFYQGRINNLKETFLRKLGDYHQTVAAPM